MVRRVTRASLFLAGCLLAGVTLGLVGRVAVSTSGRAFDRFDVDLSLVSSRPAEPADGSATPPDDERPPLPPLAVYGADSEWLSDLEFADSERSHPRFALFEQEPVAAGHSGPALPPPEDKAAAGPRSSEATPTRTAEAEVPPTMPERLPDVDDHAAPIDKSADAPTADAVLRKIIERELPEATADERQIWLEELRGLSASAVRDLLQLRRMIGRPGQDFAPVPRETDAPPAPPRLANTPRPDVPRDSLEGWNPGAVPDDEAFHPLPPLPQNSTLATIETSTSALREAMSIVSNNLANSRSAGFKKVRLVLSDLPYERPAADEFSDESDDEVSPSDEWPSVGLGMYVAATEIDPSPGELRATGNPWDVAIDGDGWFAVRMGDVTRLTRAGRLGLDSQRRLVVRLAGRRWPIEPGIVIPEEARSVEFQPDGSIIVQGSSGEPTVAGRLQTVAIDDASSLQPCGSGLYVASKSSRLRTGYPGEQGLGEIRSGRLESSNVKVKDELDELHELRTLWQALLTARPPHAP